MPRLPADDLTASTVHTPRYNTLYVWSIAFVAALGGLLFGYDWVVIGGAKPFYEPYFGLTSAQLSGWANSCALIGCLLGSVGCGALSDRYGRKKLLILSAVVFAVSSFCTGWAETFPDFVVWRMLGGVAIGIASNVSPTYIAEVSPAPWRGRLVTLNQLTIVVGILLAQIVNWLIAEPVEAGATAAMIRESWNGQWGWRWMFIAVAVPSTVFLLCSLLIPESPRWLIKRGRPQSARTVLERIGGREYATDALRDIHDSLSEESSKRATGSKVFTSSVLALLVTGVGLAVLQQWSGINVIFNYAEDIYRDAGYGVSGILFNIVVTGTINLLFTLLALNWVDRIGRRPLMLWGCAGIGVSHAALGFTYALGLGGLPVLLLTLLTIACYATSLAPITWVLISEIFPNRVRGLAVSIAVSALWLACFILTFTFPILKQYAGPAVTFWLYSAICFAGLIFVWFRVPETRGKTLEAIELEASR